MTRSFGAPVRTQQRGRVADRGTVVFANQFRAAKNREIELFQRNRVPIFSRDQFPRVGNRFFLEIIAERKIAEHFEKRVMAIGEADIFEVVVLAAGANAFLASCGAFVIALFEAEEDVLELVHPRVGEEQRGIVRGDKRRAAHVAMAALLEESQKCFADFVACQIVCPQRNRFIIADAAKGRKREAAP